MKILVVEDDPASQCMMQVILEPYGTIDLAETGSAAVDLFLAAVRSEPYDLVCLDLMLPQMNGHEILQVIRTTEKNLGVAHEKRARVIITSALDDWDNIEESFQGQCEAYLVKPILKNKLLAQLRSLKLID